MINTIKFTIVPCPMAPIVEVDLSHLVIPRDLGSNPCVGVDVGVSKQQREPYIYRSGTIQAKMSFEEEWWADPDTKVESGEQPMLTFKETQEDLPEFCYYNKRGNLVTVYNRESLAEDVKIPE